MCGGAMEHFLSLTHHCEQRKGGFNHHAVIPSPLQTQFQVVGNARFTAEAQVRQDHTILVEQLHQRQEVLVRTIHRQPMPTDYLTDIVATPAQFNANEPTPFSSTFLAQLLLGTSL